MDETLWRMTIGEFVLTMVASLAMLIIIGAVIQVINVINEAFWNWWRD